MLSQSNHSAVCTCTNATVLRASTMIAARRDSERLTDYFVRILAHGLREMRSLLKGKHHVQQWLCVMACRPNLRHGSRRGSETEAKAESFLRCSSLDGLTGSWSASSRFDHDFPRGAGCRAVKSVRVSTTSDQYAGLCVAAQEADMSHTICTHGALL